MTYRQLLEEGRTYRVITTLPPWSCWIKIGKKKKKIPEKRPIDWERGCMTEREAKLLYHSLDHDQFMIAICVDYKDQIEKLAVKEDSNDTRSINEREPYERMLPVDKWEPKNKHTKSNIPLFVNILFGIPLLILRSALKH